MNDPFIWPHRNSVTYLKKKIKKIKTYTPPKSVQPIDLVKKKYMIQIIIST